MKLVQFFTATLLTCGIPIYAQTPEQKIYLKSDQIHLEKGDIRVQIDGKEIPLSALHNDVYGIYVLPEEIMDEYSPQEFPIPYCNYGHPSPRKDGFCSWPGCPYNR